EQHSVGGVTRALQTRGRRQSRFPTGRRCAMLLRSPASALEAGLLFTSRRREARLRSRASRHTESPMTRAAVALFALVTFAPSVPAADHRPDPRAVRRHGPAYRYPQAGWVVLHIEGGPYERGFQHGKLLAPEIGRASCRERGETTGGLASAITQAGMACAEPSSTGARTTASTCSRTLIASHRLRCP